MTDRDLQHRRVHHVLLLQKILSLRQGSSPFTLILDTVEQSAHPLIERLFRAAEVRLLIVASTLCQ